jgi:hypothetical protein
MLIPVLIKYTLAKNVKYNQRTFENGYLYIYIIFSTLTSVVLTIVTLVLTKVFDFDRFTLLCIFVPLIFITPIFVTSYVKINNLVYKLKMEVDGYSVDKLKRCRTVGMIVGLSIACLPLLTLAVINILDQSGVW